MSECVGVTALDLGYERERLVDLGLPEAVAEPLVQRESGRAVGHGLVVITEP
jgi:hypothetical protein